MHGLVIGIANMLEFQFGFGYVCYPDHSPRSDAVIKDSRVGFLVKIGKFHLKIFTLLQKKVI